MIGSAVFKDKPNEKGEVEIGYGLRKRLENNGFMAEAVQAMCAWAMKQEQVSHIIAETDLNGLASQYVLTKYGFSEYKRDETSWWRL